MELWSCGSVELLVFGLLVFGTVGISGLFVFGGVGISGLFFSDAKWSLGLNCRRSCPCSVAARVLWTGCFWDLLVS